MPDPAPPRRSDVPARPTAQSPGAGLAWAELAAALALLGEAAFGRLGALLSGRPAEAADAPLGVLATLLRKGDVPARVFADAASAALDGAGQVAGRYATPWPLADFLAEQLAAARSGPAVVLDPACGVGHLLVALAERGSVSDPLRWHGWDTSAAHVQAARIALWLATGRRGRPADFGHLRPLDALLEAPPLAADLLLANPPFVSIRTLCRSRGPAYAQRLRDRFRALRGSFDLYVPFLLALPQWLADGGRFGLVLPSALWSADYAGPARELLAARLTDVVRITPRVPFGRARVAAQILVGGALPSSAAVRSHTAELGAGALAVAPDRDDGSAEVPSPTAASPPAARARPHPAPLRSLLARGDWSPGCIALGAASVPLAQVARLEAGTPGYMARQTAARLRQGDTGEEALPFVVSRSIDRYRLHLDRPVRFLGQRWDRPHLPLAELTAGKRRLFEGQKVLVAGVSRRLEAARDAAGVALGVGVYAVLPERLPTELVLALLNSQAVSEWYRQRYQGRELSGGYFGVNRGQLGAIPVPAAWLTHAGEAGEVVALVQERERLPWDADMAALDERLDALVAEALGLAPI